jgi:hypothetical protein
MRTAYAAVISAIIIAAIALAGPAAAAPGSPMPKPVITTQDRVFSILCPAIFVIIAGGGGLIIILRRSARKKRLRDAPETIVPWPASSGLSMSHAQRDYQNELEDKNEILPRENEEDDDEPPNPWGRTTA